MFGVLKIADGTHQKPKAMKRDYSPQSELIFGNGIRTYSKKWRFNFHYGIESSLHPALFNQSLEVLDSNRNPCNHNGSIPSRDLIQISGLPTGPPSRLQVARGAPKGDFFHCGGQSFSFFTPFGTIGLKLSHPAGEVSDHFFGEHTRSRPFHWMTFPTISNK